MHSTLIGQSHLAPSTSAETTPLEETVVGEGVRTQAFSHAAGGSGNQNSLCEGQSINARIL